LIIVRHTNSLSYYYRPLFRDNLGNPVTEGKNSPDLNETREDGVLGCSGISWTICNIANNLQLAPDRKPHQHLTAQFLHAACSFWCPTNSVKALKALSIEQQVAMIMVATARIASRHRELGIRALSLSCSATKFPCTFT